MWFTCCIAIPTLVEAHANSVRDLEYSAHYNFMAIPNDIKTEWLLFFFAYVILRLTRDKSDVALTLASADYLLFICHISFTPVEIFVYVLICLIVCVRLLTIVHHVFSYQVLNFIIFLEFLFIF